MKEFENLYLAFRQELDKICVPEIIKNRYETRKIKYEGKTVGILCGECDYIDCIYVVPEYRRKGLARDAALEYYKDYEQYDIRLHIINSNRIAKKFWHSLFELELITKDVIDGLYRIKGVKI